VTDGTADFCPVIPKFTLKGRKTGINFTG